MSHMLYHCARKKSLSHLNQRLHSIHTNYKKLNTCYVKNHSLVFHRSKFFFELQKIQLRTNSYYRHKYSDKVESAVNRQIQAEQQAAQDYLSIAVCFLHPCISRPGAGGFFMLMYEEELNHMKEFIQYQLLRGGTVAIGSLNTPPRRTNLTLYEAFNQALLMEKCITELLENLVSLAESEKDYQCADFVTSIFLAEQMRSINEMSHHVTKLSKLCDEHAFYHYDVHLGKTHPYKYKPQILSNNSL